MKKNKKKRKKIRNKKMQIFLLKHEQPLMMNIKIFKKKKI
jgi:hypothetical protein